MEVILAGRAVCAGVSPSRRDRELEKQTAIARNLVPGGFSQPMPTSISYTRKMILKLQDLQMSVYRLALAT